jgi:hypothetical protein
MLNAAVTEPVLNRPRIMTRIGQRIAAAVAKHVGMNLERHSGALADALNKAIDSV